MAIPLTIAPALDQNTFHQIRTRLTLDHCKWDPQVGDRPALFPQALLLDSHTWDDLADWSEAMAGEISAAETELACRPDLQRTLGVPRSLRWVLKRGLREGFTACAARVMRFDFHLTTEGWQVSEVNSDVPGGFTEASIFTERMALHYRRARIAGSPLTGWTAAMVDVTGGIGTVALLSAPGYMEDQQVTAVLADCLHQRGIATRLIHRANQLEWRSGYARMVADAMLIGAIVRFYQAEWVCRFRRSAWERFFVGGRTPVSNHGLAVLSESKRLPLIWDHLDTRMDACRALFPEARDPRNAAWQGNDEWVVKAVFSNTGDHVSTRDRLPREQWQSLGREVKRRPEQWVLQRRFSPVL
ncbi:MAG TPA: glutathionylspermidine synthase family protein [Terriglobales bacterium]|nr:glutathionylspermidine synthase family protein [Terriglobales bacterium]